MARILAISSHVVRGHVGLAATVPALQWLGHEVWALPTVLLASRPGLGKFVRHEPPPANLAAMLSALEADGCWASLDAVATGYFPSSSSVTGAAAAIRRIKQVNSRVIVLVDPILGDAGRLYVAEDTAEAIRDELLCLATIATPNLFELQWLSGSTPSGANDIVEAAQRLGPATVVVTSAWETPTRIATVLAIASEHIERTVARRPGIPHGTGDLLAGLLLGHMLNDQSAQAALDVSLADLDRVLAASEDQPILQLSALTASRASQPPRTKKL